MAYPAPLRRQISTLPRPRLTAATITALAFPAGLVSAFVVGSVVRAHYTFSSSFPLNDGGLFFAMTRDLQRHGYLLPGATTYNDASIPFSYPPLGFYLSGLLDTLTPLSLLDAFRLVPLVATCLTMPAFYLLARQLISSRAALLAAVVALALVPRSFIWLLMGGGVTRSLGFLFAVLALQQVHQMYAKRSWRFAPATAFFATLTLLSHVETAWFLAVSIGVFFMAFGRSREALVMSATVGIAAVALAAPWWASVLVQHGPAPFVAAFGSGGSVLSDGATRAFLMQSIARVVSTSEPFFPLIGVLATLGALASVVGRRWVLPAWWIAVVLMDARAFATFTTLPVALLAGIGLCDVLIPALNRAAVSLGEGESSGEWVTQAAAATARPATAAVAIFMAVFALWSALQDVPGSAGESQFLESLSADERAAMAWVQENTPPESRFLIVPQSTWETAKTSEWFPELAARVSVATVQGSEWLPGGEFNQRVEDFYSALDCGYKTDDCLDNWELATGRSFTHVYLAKPPEGQCCSTLLESLLHDPRYRMVYDGRGATIFTWSPDLPAASTR